MGLSNGFCEVGLLHPPRFPLFKHSLATADTSSSNIQRNGIRSTVRSMRFLSAHLQSPDHDQLAKTALCADVHYTALFSNANTHYPIGFSGL